MADPNGSVALCRPMLYTFARLITSSRVFGPDAGSVRRGWKHR
jgi:hypothetical protein